MLNETKKRLSKFLAFVLRHEPQTANLSLDARGFCIIEDVIKAATAHLRTPVVRADLEELSRPSTDPREKTRYEIEGEFIRAGHGHSVPITGYRTCAPTKPLYHASPRSSIDAIRNSGLKPMARQKVHLSFDRAITKEAARRRDPNVVLIEIDVVGYLATGKTFFESADPRIILSDEIPSKFLRYPEHPEWNPPILTQIPNNSRILDVD